MSVLAPSAGKTTRRLPPPVVVTALIWIGVQVLVLLYLRTALGVLIEREPLLAQELREALAGEPDGGLAVRAWMWVVNLSFVLLLWLRFRSRPWPSPGQRRLALLTYGGTALLLLLMHPAWNRLGTFELPWTLERIGP